MARSFRPNSAGIGAILRSAEVQAACVAEAERAKGVAEGLAVEITKTGEYLSSFEVRPESVAVVSRRGITLRAGAVLENTSPHAAAVEWGNARDHRPHHILTRAIDGIGHPFEGDL